MQSMFEELSNFEPFNEIFTDNNKAISFMIRHVLIISEIPCKKNNCDGIMKIQNTSKYSDGMGFRCRVKKCKSLLSVKAGSKFEGLTIDCKKILRCFYCWVYSYTNYQAIAYVQVSEPSYIKMKDLIMDVLGSETGIVERIGGEGVRVQIDETAICNGLVISDPSNSLDNLPNIQWIVGGVVEGDCKKFFLKLVLNRKVETMLEVFRECILPGSVLVTDGYPSYPRAVREFGSVHEVVNHNHGFVTVDGVNTNQIENLWSHLKQDYRGRVGVNHSRIVLFINEFSWIKKNITHSIASTHKTGFITLLLKFKMTN